MGDAVAEDVDFSSPEIAPTLIIRVETVKSDVTRLFATAVDNRT
ncbi:hypothetical protein [Pengzhenrongella sicca]|nr:hypothetical protein [Pengzhenrongella sicca]